MLFEGANCLYKAKEILTRSLLFILGSCFYFLVLLVFPLMWYPLEGFLTLIFNFLAQNEITTRIQANQSLTDLIWTYPSATYYSFVTISTIGYGDIYAKTHGGRVDVIAYTTVGFIAFGLFIATFIGPVFNFVDFIFDVLNWPVVFLIKNFLGIPEEKIQKLTLHPLLKTLIIINFVLFYILISAAIIGSIEDWDFSSSIWFIYITLSTIGYGDMSPSTERGRVFICFFSFFGIGMLSLLIGYISESITPRIEGFTRFMQEFCKRFKLSEKWTQKLTSEERVTVLLNAFIFIICTLSLFIYLFILSIPLWVIESKNEILQTGKNPKWTYGNSIYYCFVTITTIGYGDFFPETSPGKVYMIFYSFFGIILFSTQSALIWKYMILIIEFILDKIFICIFKKVFPKTLAYKCIKTSIISILLFGYILICALIQSAIEAINYYDAIWWAWITITTIGYGDITPETDGGKLFMCFYAFFGIGLLLVLIGSGIEFFKLDLEKENELIPINRELEDKKIQVEEK